MGSGARITRLGYFKDRTLTIDYHEYRSRPINVCRGALQGSCFGPKAFIVNHYDLPMNFENPSAVHLYVDDLTIVYIPPISQKYAIQKHTIQSLINKDLEKRRIYTEDNLQPVNVKKTESDHP
ncbi:unnamed protein product [Adineta ricciae]|uniref:Reverse transcriptase domain-containing protein n=1 Tax=Adineta ricciae TaxID=249248 RepID=A0A815UR30_ADIRI|nr:unnamed protein product [Adineta ricciae]